MSASRSIWKAARWSKAGRTGAVSNITSPRPWSKPASREARRAMTAERVYNVLFLCTGNSARSILAEVLIEHWGKGRFNGYSAGSFPKGAVHPLALEELERHHLQTSGLHSKSWS